MLKKIYSFFLIVLGIDFKTLIYSIYNFPWFTKQLYEFKRLGGNIDKIHPFLNDYKISSGIYSHDLFQNSYLVKKSLQYKPKNLLDISSKIEPIIYLSNHLKVHYLGLELLDSNYPIFKNISFDKYDLLDKPNEKYIHKFDFVSSLYVIAHVGLGRYRDRLDPQGHLIALYNITKYIKPGGKLLISVPITINSDSIHFNAHRVFNLKSIPEFLSPEKLNLIEFSYVDDSLNYFENADIESVNTLQFGCGIYLFTKGDVND